MQRASESPRLDAQILLAWTLERDKEWLIAHGECDLTDSQAEIFAKLCEKRATGMPVAYITGRVGFYGREFVVSDAVLIPRPETEHLTEDAIAHLRSRATGSDVLDVGTGSGAIACTIAAEFPGAIVDGTDTSEAALEVARGNARLLGVRERCTFYRADIVDERNGKTFDVVVANLPYVPTNQIPRRPDSVGFEPLVALDGGPDGLGPYRKLLALAPRLLRPGALLLMEAAPPTIEALAILARSACAGALVEVRPDYAGLERYVSVRDGGGRSG